MNRELLAQKWIDNVKARIEYALREPDTTPLEIHYLHEELTEAFDELSYALKEDVPHNG